MPSVRVTEHIAAPVDRVFDLLTDLEQMPNHIDGIDSVQILSEGPFGVGTRWKETRTMMGKQASEEMEVSEFVPNDHYTTLAESCGARYSSTWRVVPRGDGTDVTMDFDATHVSFFAKLMSPLSKLMSGVIVKCIRQDLSDLKRKAEAG